MQSPLARNRTFGALLVSGIAAGSLADARKPDAWGSYVITVENMKFNPPSLSVRRGDRIVWVNKDMFPHTVTAASKAFDSHEVASGASWTYVADKPGEYAYSCIYHPTMKGKITVR